VTHGALNRRPATQECRGESESENVHSEARSLPSRGWRIQSLHSYGPSNL
jgi:hypothetical protein